VPPTPQRSTMATGAFNSLGYIPPEPRSKYIAVFSSRLNQDISKLPCFSGTPDVPRELLLEWVRNFASKLHGESSTQSRRDASVFIRTHREYVLL
jgi:hypothetical protein